MVGVRAAEVQRLAGWGAVAGAGAADHARGHGLVEPPPARIAVRGIRNIRNRRNSAGGGVADGIVLLQHAGLGVGVLLQHRIIRNALTWGVAPVADVAVGAQVACPGVEEVGALIAAGRGVADADDLGLDPVGPQPGRQPSGVQPLAEQVIPGGFLQPAEPIQHGLAVQPLILGEDLAQVGQQPRPQRGVFLLLAFGLQWLRKAVLRASGRKAKRDEDAKFAREVEEARAQGGRSAFALVFQGVLLEELEVAVIVLTLGAAHGSVPLAAAAAAAALVVVTAAAAFARHPLSRVPENALSLAVGVMLTSFGVFWTIEGARIEWPGGDAMLPLLVAAVATSSWAAIYRIRRAPTKLDA